MTTKTENRNQDRTENKKPKTQDQKPKTKN